MRRRGAVPWGAGNQEGSTHVSHTRNVSQACVIKLRERRCMLSLGSMFDIGGNQDSKQCFP